MPRIAVLLLLLLAFASGEDFNPGLLRNGDLIFQTSRSGQSMAIQLATGSVYSHCGIVYIKGGDYYVFEASTKVKRSPLKRFLRKGDGGRFVVKRLGGPDSLALTPEALRKMEEAGKKLEGLPYDLYFGWDDDRIYCSELIYKIYRNALGLKLGVTRKLKDFDLTHPLVAAKLKERYGDQLPLDETVIAPSDLFADPRLIQIYSNFVPLH